MTKEYISSAFHTSKRKRSGSRVPRVLIAAGLGLLCCLSAMTTPAQAGFSADQSAQEETQSTWFDVQVTDADGTQMQNPITLGVATEDLHYFVLTAQGTASKGYYEVTATSQDGKTAKYYIINIQKKQIINVVVRAASKTEIQFTPCWGTPTVREGERVVEPVETVSWGSNAPLMVYLEISQTPSVAYLVPVGERLEDIAERYGVAPEDILLFNGIDSIEPGDKIEIPNPATEERNVPGVTYTVAEGDTLQSIAQAYGITPDALRQANPGISADIYANQVLTIPSADTESTEKEPPEPTETEATEPTELEETRDDTVYVNGIPVYYQNDYPDILYGNGTVETSGCGITCLAMVATRMTGHEYLPDELADYFGGCAENNIDRLEYGSKTLQLSFSRAENADYVWPALAEGKIAIVLMNETSLFTSSQHFIILAGVNEKGGILVIDPNKENYDNPLLANAFVNGFNKEDILLGYSGAWLYDPATMPETPFIYSEPRLDFTHLNYPEVTLTSGERELLAKLIWAEARGECAEGQQAVAEVVLNRLVSNRFSNTLSGVIYAEGQFESVELGKLKEAAPCQAQYQAIDRALHGNPVLNRSVFFFATVVSNETVYKTIGSHTFY